MAAHILFDKKRFSLRFSLFSSVRGLEEEAVEGDIEGDVEEEAVEGDTEGDVEEEAVEGDTEGDV